MAVRRRFRTRRIRHAVGYCTRVELNGRDVVGLTVPQIGWLFGVQTVTTLVIDTNRSSTVFLRKAVNDPFRRTYVRLSHLSRPHVKVGLEKAPIGIEQLTANGQIPFVDRSEVTDRFAAADEMRLVLEDSDSPPDSRYAAGLAEPAEIGSSATVS
jgi:hypothetical protein